MTHQSNFPLPSEMLEQIAAQVFHVLPELIRIVINATMQTERQQNLGAAPYLDSPAPRGYTNGYKSQNGKTHLCKTVQK